MATMIADDSTPKVCVHCEQPKPRSAFPANGKTRDGKSSWCQQCHTEYRRDWLANLKTKPAEYREFVDGELKARRERYRRQRRATAQTTESLAA